MNKYRVPEVQKIGIYAIHNTINNRYYIGSSINIYNRMLCHARDMKNKGCAYNRDLTIDLIIYGYDSFVFEVLETFEDSTINDKCLKDREQVYIDFLKPDCYNKNKAWEIRTNSRNKLLVCPRKDIKSDLRKKPRKP